MKNLILTISLMLSAAVFSKAHAFGFDNLTPGQKVLLHLEMKKKLSGKSKKRKSKPVNCVEVFNKEKQRYLDEVCNGESRYMEVGFMSRKFSKDEIQNMPKRHPHLREAVRGNRELVKRSVLGGRPDYPHANRRCENYFSEEVEVVEIDGKSCRRITFTAPEINGSYIQQYCEDDSSLFLYFE
jgi:hypothetical protein